MPELPAVTVYVECLRAKTLGHTLEKIRVASPSLVQTYDPSYRECVGRDVGSVHRIGKRLVLGFPDELYLVLHLMIAGRLRWKKPGLPVPKKRGLAAFYFAHGTLLLTEASSHKRASLHCVRGRDALTQFDRGGLEVIDCAPKAFATALRRENRTLKRAMTDPRILNGIGNAYSDEILHAAQLSPMKRTRSLSDDEIERLRVHTREQLLRWTEQSRRELKDGFPDKVTAFRKGMAVHGRHREPCPACGTPVQRIVYAENECNYCPTCQTEGRLLSDRSLARLLKEDWPKTAEELEALRSERR